MQLSFTRHSECDILTEGAGQQLQSGTFPGQTRHLKLGGSLWLPSDLPDSIFLLLSGAVRISRIDANGKETLLRTVRPGELFGEFCYCIYRDLPHHSIAVASAPSHIRQTTFSAFQAALKRNEELNNCMLTTLCRRAADAEERATVLAIHDARTRLATLLLQLSLRVPSADRSRVPVHRTHADLAAISGLTRPHVTVLMTRLRSEGLIEYSRGSAILVPVAKLSSALTEA